MSNLKLFDCWEVETKQKILASKEVAIPKKLQLKKSGDSKEVSTSKKEQYLRKCNTE